tara:strand:- start:1238 stop:2155 length:918 start_codon:yes stop_codon:yes gene_type:complete
MKDCWHFITKDGLIFTTRGNIHPEGFIRAIGLYLPDEKGDRVYSGKKYSKIIDEYGNKWVKEKHPGYVINDDEGTKILVPIKNIDKYFDPFAVSKETREIIRKTKWGKLIIILEKLIPREDIGFIGSYLIGFPTDKSDIDIIIRGLGNLKIIKNKFNNILEELDAKPNLEDYLTKISLEKYYNLYSKEKNDFSKMIENRWATIKTKEYMTKLRFVPKNNEVDFPIVGKKIKEIEISGKVIDDIGTNIMPRFFNILTEKDKFTVLTYFWDYTYCVKKGDEININGNLFEKNIILINDRDKDGITFN